MKRLIFINILLAIFLNVLPQTNANERNCSQMVASEQVSEQVTSRSLSEPREIMIEHPVPTQISQEGIELIKKFEGLELESYKLEGETNYTIGYGTSNSSIKEGQKITVEEAERLLMEEVQKVTVQVLNHCDYLDLTQSQLDGLISFTYNVGYSNLKKLTGNGTRTIEEIAEHITAYTKSGSEKNRKGLEARRNEEKQFIENV